MAKVTASGNIKKVAFTKYGKQYFTFWETMNINGKEYFRTWTVWMDQEADVHELDWVEVEGRLSTKVGEYNGKQIVEHSMNEPRLVRHVPETSGKFGSNGKADAPVDDIEAPF